MTNLELKQNESRNDGGEVTNLEALRKSEEWDLRPGRRRAAKVLRVRSCGILIFGVRVGNLGETEKEGLI
jgi:hypothetical protein